jgi:hypothetical protein
MNSSSWGKQDETDANGVNDDDDDDAIPPVNPLKLRSLLQQFAHQGARRFGNLAEPGTFRNNTSTEENRSLNENTTIAHTAIGKRKSSNTMATTNDGPNPKRNKAVIKRSYAPPEQYHHLKHLTDFLQPELESKYVITKVCLPFDFT